MTGTGNLPDLCIKITALEQIQAETATMGFDVQKVDTASSVVGSQKPKIIKDKYAELVEKQRMRDERLERLRQEKQEKKEAEEMSHMKPRFNQKGSRSRADEITNRFSKYTNDYKDKREMKHKRREEQLENQKKQWFKPKINSKKVALPAEI